MVAKFVSKLVPLSHEDLN